MNKGNKDNKRKGYKNKRYRVSSKGRRHNTTSGRGCDRKENR